MMRRESDPSLPTPEEFAALWGVEPPATDSPASVSPEQTPSPAVDPAHSSDQCTVGETP